MKTKEQELQEELNRIKGLVQNVESKIEELKLSKEDKFAELKEAYNNGADIQWRRAKDGKLVWEDCHENDPPTWRHYNEYRIKPEDKFADLKEAHKNGAVIQFKTKHTNNKWVDCRGNMPSWVSTTEYRIKPEEKPQPGDVCKFWNDGEEYFTVGVLSCFYESICRYSNPTNDWYKYAKKLTKEEAIELLFGSED